jgi:2,5-diketo-D-gluconate reductase A
MTAPTLTLNDGNMIPQIGLGTGFLTDDEIAPIIVRAVEAGYRHIDTAVNYGNETGIGRGIVQSGIAREDLFVTTKVDGTYQGQDRAIVGLDGALSRLRLDYVDLLLIHWPLPWRDEYVSTWRTFEKLLDSGKARSIGLSNFKPRHIDRLFAETSVRLTINQIQLNPRISRAEQRDYNAAHGILTESWSPLGRGNDLLSEPVLLALAEKYGKMAGQIVLRWHIELGLVAIPRSSNATRIAQNIDVFDFVLAPDEVTAITALDTGAEPRVDSDQVGTGS